MKATVLKYVYATFLFIWIAYDIFSRTNAVNSDFLLTTHIKIQWLVSITNILLLATLLLFALMKKDKPGFILFLVSGGILVQLLIALELIGLNQF